MRTAPRATRSAASLKGMPLCSAMAPLSELDLLVLPRKRERVRSEQVLVKERGGQKCGD